LLDELLNGVVHDVASDEPRITPLAYMIIRDATDNAYRRSKVKEGDIVVAIRATVGKCLPVPKMLAGANLTQGTAKISPGTRIRSSFLLSFMSSQYVQTMLNSQAKGATFREITLDMLRRTPLLVPPLREQSYISSYVASTTERFDKLTRAAKKQQMLLQERRTALISAAVTGKIDVRNWRPDTSTQVVESDLPMAAEQAAEYRV
jgi:type I restriction enzyme S subunit